MKTVIIAAVPAEIRTDYLWNTNLQHYSYIIFLSSQTGGIPTFREDGVRRILRNINNQIHSVIKIA
jgi:hypothetical protein